MCKHIVMCRATPEKFERLDGGQIHAPAGGSSVTGLYTIGHSNHSLDGFLSLLSEHQIAVLVDVRSSPWSKFNPHFARPSLRAAVLGLGVNYFWAGKELGGLAPLATTNQLFQGRMKQVVGISQEQRLAMMCSEGNPKDCHRAYKLAAYLHRVDGPDVLHILRDGSAVDSREFEAQQSESWLHQDFGGTKT